MSHTSWKERISLRGLFIHMGIECVAGEMSKMFDVLHRNLARRGMKRFSYLKTSKTAGEWVIFLFYLFCTRHPFLPHAGQNIGTSLKSGTLHVMHHTADTAHFFATPSATWAAMHHMGQGRSMSGTFRHRGSVIEIQPSVKGGAF